MLKAKSNSNKVNLSDLVNRAKQQNIASLQEGKPEDEEDAVIQDNLGEGLLAQNGPLGASLKSNLSRGFN